MNVKYSFVCESANICSNGNLNVLGIFTRINSKDFPYVNPRMYFVLGLETTIVDFGNHFLKVNFIDEDGAQIIPTISGDLNVQNETKITNILFDLTGITFKKPGTYSFDIIVDNVLIRTELLEISQLI